MYYYDKFLQDIDLLKQDISKFKSEKKYKEADLLKLKLIYTKINYYTECIKTNPRDKVYKYNLDNSLNEIGDFRDYLYETYQYEEN